MLAIAWQYLSGRSVAATHAQRHEAEWPPHPDRVFQALVAAWGETGCDAAQRRALEWLEAQGAPGVAAPGDDQLTYAATSVYVPVNDVQRSAPGRATDALLRVMPQQRPKKERTFATVLVGNQLCALIWPDAEANGHRAALADLCAAVTHIGHSRSLVRAWLEETPPPERFRAVLPGQRRDLSLRVPHRGRLAALVHAFAEGGADWKRPPAAPWAGYAEVRTSEPDTRHGDFDRRLIVFRRVGGEGMASLRSAPNFVSAFRATLQAKANARAMPWVSGHQPDGARFDGAHVAWLPLAHVGHEHADGHLLGMAIALPCNMSNADEQAVLNSIADAFDPESENLTLRAGPAGTLVLNEDEGHPARARALRPETWTGPALQWGSVTPIVLDRLPPRRHEGDDGWVAGQIALSCVRQGMPEPVEILLRPVSVHRGAPTCREFPPLLRKPDGARRWHVHACLRFAEPVEGPLLLGAGRYRGYGLCKPLPADFAASG